MRTSFKHQQLRIMKVHFLSNPNPDSKDLKELSERTGLQKRVLQVFIFFSYLFKSIFNLIVKFHYIIRFGFKIQELSKENRLQMDRILARIQMIIILARHQI